MSESSEYFGRFLMKHIANPCVEIQSGENIRDFYIREAEKAIESKKIDCYGGIETLKAIVQIFSDKNR